jgi:hypothetical protein
VGCRGVATKGAGSCRHPSRWIARTGRG